MTGRGLPLTVTAGLTTAGSVVGVLAVVGLVLQGGGSTPTALLTGLATGLLLSLVVAGIGGQVGAALRALRAESSARLQDPAAPVERAPHLIGTFASAEIGDLAAVLEALHLRVRLGDQVGERHRLQAETAGAGTFELLSGLVAAEEGTRGQLAAELHDTVAQSLMIARNLLAAGPSTAEELDRLRDHLEDAEEQVRAVMARTRPPALREGDLASAVDDLRRDVQARYGLTVDVAWPASPYPLPLASAITVYRFFQEALLNVVKHADVDEATVALSVEVDLVRATVTDAGPGFDPLAVRPQRGRQVGLGLLRERARLSGGSLEVTSAPGEGTTLVLQLPRPVGEQPRGPVPRVLAHR